MELEIQRLRRDLRACSEQERRLIRLYQYGEIDDDFIRRELGQLQERSQRLTTELEELSLKEEELTKLEKLEPKLLELCERVRQNLRQFGFEEKRLVLDALSVRMIAYRDRLEIRGAIPTYVTIGRTWA